MCKIVKGVTVMGELMKAVDVVGKKLTSKEFGNQVKGHIQIHFVRKSTQIYLTK